MAAVDFGDEEAVLAEVAKALGADPEELSIDEDRGLSGFGAGTAYRVEWGREEYVVVEDSDQMEQLAIEVVKQDLDEEPEIFNRDFIERHIDTEQLRKELWQDVVALRSEEVDGYDPEEFWDQWEQFGLGDAPEEDENGELPEPSQNDINDLTEKMTEEALQDPMEYLEDIYGREDAAKEAIKIAGIDVDAAAQDAVDTDGAEHFLARYDGNSYETKGGLVYWRDS